MLVECALGHISNMEYNIKVAIIHSILITYDSKSIHSRQSKVIWYKFEQLEWSNLGQILDKLILACKVCNEL